MLDSNLQGDHFLGYILRRNALAIRSSARHVYDPISDSDHLVYDNLLERSFTTWFFGLFYAVSWVIMDAYVTQIFKITGNMIDGYLSFLFSVGPSLLINVVWMLLTPFVGRCVIIAKSNLQLHFAR